MTERLILAYIVVVLYALAITQTVAAWFAFLSTDVEAYHEITEGL